MMLAQGTVRDAVLAVAINRTPYVVRVSPFGGLSPVPRLVYHDAFPVARLGFLNMSLCVLQNELTVLLILPLGEGRTGEERRL